VGLLVVYTPALETRWPFTKLTVGLQKRNGQWLMIHDHVSMPFDMETMQAVADLRQ
jgi:hypothetical protein